MYISETYAQKWAPVLDHPELPKINDQYKRAVTALVLENQEHALREQARAMSGNLFEATPINVAPTDPSSGNIQGFDPILIGLVRRALRNLMAYDICGVQPMTGPTGLIFAMRSRYGTPSGDEAFYNEANTQFAGNTSTSLGGDDGTNVTPTLGMTQMGNTLPVLANIGAPKITANAETEVMNQMAFSIERVAVTAKTRGLQASYTMELAQDLKAIHGLDAETELTNILSTEILAEINREVVRSVYAVANVGIVGVSSNTYNLSSNVDTSGRWQVEKYKSLLFQIERACNKIAKDTRRGKGNMLIVSTDVASALAMTGLLDYNSALTNNTNLTVDDTGNTFAGVLFGRLKVYVDPYSVTGTDWVVVGYKGPTPYDAGLFYCPYVPLQMVRAIDPENYQPKIGFKTRYGMVSNPFSGGPNASNGTLVNGTNVYYRKFRVLNISQ